MKKQELIDKAVESKRGLVGKGNESASVVLWDGEKFYLVTTAYAMNANALNEGDVICTIEEYKQRAKELGWINGVKQPLGNSEQLDNSWYEQGEFPPVGWHGQITWGAKVKWYECVILPNGRIARDTQNHDWGIFEIDKHADVQFRPIKSEREKFVDVVLSLMPLSVNIDAQKAIVRALYDAGFRAPEEK